MASSVPTINLGHAMEVECRIPPFMNRETSRLENLNTENMQLWTSSASFWESVIWSISGKMSKIQNACRQKVWNNTCNPVFSLNESMGLSICRGSETPVTGIGTCLCSGIAACLSLAQKSPVYMLPNESGPSSFLKKMYGYVSDFISSKIWIPRMAT